SEPSRGMLMIGRAVDGAESCLNENLFADANIGVCREIYSKSSEVSVIFLCLVVAVDSNNPAWDKSLISYFALCLLPKYNYRLELREGEWVITMVRPMVAPDDWFRLHFDDWRSRGMLKKGIWVEVKKDEMWKSVQMLSTIVDKLYHS
ncbi:hypothetical protein SUGI_0673500, partial [Cryptomeria japonica]